MVRLGLAGAGIAFGIVGACTFPDPATEDPTGNGGAPAGTTSTSIVGSSSGTDTPATSSTSSSSSAGGNASSSVSSSSDGGGGTSSSSDGGGGASTSDGGGGGGTLVGVGGGVVDVACDNGCVPFPNDGSGGAGGAGGAGGFAGGTADNCDGDADLNADDCQPCNPDVFRGQTDFFGVPFATFEDPKVTSFDYDCSGGTARKYNRVPNGCTSIDLSVCPDEPIYADEDASCGTQATVENCEVSGFLGVLGSCAVDGSAETETVECH